MGVALITGGSGLIGQHVVRQWSSDTLDPYLVARGETDLLVPGAAAALVDRWRPAVVVHLAWCASGTPGYRSAPDNERWVDATLELAAACWQAGAWLLATGTALDRSTVGDDDYYSLSKTRLRAALDPAIGSSSCTWLRPFYVVDPDRRRPSLVDQALSAAAAGTPISLATPDSAHDFVHAADVGTAVVATIRAGVRGEVDIGTGRLRRVRDLVEALGVSWQPATDGGAVSPQHTDAADITSLRALGWSPVFTKELFHGE